MFFSIFLDIGGHIDLAVFKLSGLVTGHFVKYIVRAIGGDIYKAKTGSKFDPVNISANDRMSSVQNLTI